MGYPRYWVGVASKEHVCRGLEGGFAQVCHGKEGPLKQMREGDGIVYYSPTVHFQGKDALRAFTAIGKIQQGEPYPFEMSPGFVPFRRNVDWIPAIDAPILPLLDKLAFIIDKTKWGFPFRRGCFSIAESDFHLIAEAMGVIFIFGRKHD